ncbi:MAG TPA: deoxynucleoside kinase [Salinivirgaceae bacterium]|nr:deoxynucleoside kinase [Salinivirgaceae bacterium]
MKFYVIEGNIGAGKTSLVEILSKKHNAKAVYEQFADNPFLPKFYANPEKYAFPLELSFLTARYSQFKNDLNPDIFSPFIISDYYFPKSLIFARKTLADDEFALYKQIFDIIYLQLPRPTLYVYLHRPVDELLENIKRRGREFETYITAEYLSSIEESYSSYIHSQLPFPVLIINCGNKDFIADEKLLAEIETQIIEKIFSKGIHYITI